MRPYSIERDTRLYWKTQMKITKLARKREGYGTIMKLQLAQKTKLQITSFNTVATIIFNRTDSQKNLSKDQRSMINSPVTALVSRNCILWCFARYSPSSYWTCRWEGWDTVGHSSTVGLGKMDRVWYQLKRWNSSYCTCRYGLGYGRSWKSVWCFDYRHITLCTWSETRVTVGEEDNLLQELHRKYTTIVWSRGVFSQPWNPKPRGVR